MRTFNSSDVGSILKSTIPVNTGTNIFTVPIEQPGDYFWTAQLWVVHGGTTTTFTATPGFSGSASPIGWSAQRYTTAGVASSLHNSFQATASSTWIIGKFNGFFRASTPGDFTLNCTRSGSGSSTIQIASNIEMFLVE